MSVISCELLAAGAQGSLDNRNQGTYQHEYLVTTNDDNDEQVVVLTQCQTVGPDQVPLKNSHYSVLDGEDSGAFLQNTSARRKTDDEGDRRHWIVTANWGPPEGGTGPTNPPNENPLLEPIRYSLEWLPNQKGISHDRLGNPIVNSAGDFFEGIEVDEPYVVVVASRNMANLFHVMEQAAEYQNTVNADVHWGGEPRTFRVESIQCSDLQVLNGIEFYRVTYRLAYNPLTWDLYVVDRGTQAYNVPKNQAGATKNPVRVLSGDNKGDLLDMANLFEDGTQVPPDNNPPGFLKLPPFRIYRETQFAGLALGSIPGQP